MGIFTKKEAETREMLDEGALDTSLRAAWWKTTIPQRLVRALSSLR